MSGTDSDEENVIKYGTPLEPYEEDEIPAKRKFQQQTDQYAVDAHGRRRFHGAFTGGFSAGFGNTVGSAEGWTPATFKSSRVEKAQLTKQRPEDFMDSEDREEYGIAPRQMQTHQEFSGQKRPRPQQYHDGPIPGEPVLGQLLEAVHETAAVKMLKAMGWRQGQGTGERVSREQKKQARDQHKVYGCYIPPEFRQNTETKEDEDSSDSDIDYDTLFAPDDYEPYILHRKNDRFGIGYSGLSRHSVLGNLVGEYGSQPGSSKSHLVLKEKGKKVSIRGQAFGVGAFEADDDDIYASEDMSHYDFALGGADVSKDKKPNKEKSKNVLEGFVKSSKPLPSAPSYPAPALPRDYRPAAAGVRRSRFEPTDQPQRDQGLGRHELTAEARGALLGETPIPEPAPQPSTNNVDKEEALLKVLGRNVNFVSNAQSEDTPQPSTKTIDKDDALLKVLGRNVNLVSNAQNEDKPLDYIPITDSGKELTKVFKPFSTDPKKQARYERYLVDKGDVWERDGKSDNLTDWEREREMVEFEQAAKLYKPLSGIMGDRFTHASEPDEALNPLCAVTKSTTNYGLATQAQIEAAEKGVYGVMTRRETEWRPESLVCKRFNIPDPGVRHEEKKEDKPKVAYSVFSYMESSVHNKDSFTKEQSTFSGSKSLQREPPKQNQEKSSKVDEIEKKSVEITPSKGIEGLFKPEITPTGFRKRMTVAELFLKESEQNKNQGIEVTETINKFDKMDLYKSIFLSDSEEDDPIGTDKNTPDFKDVPKNVERNTSPPRGIFANINFDELNAWKRNVDKPQAENKKEEKVEEKETSVLNEEQYYGPKIPDSLKKRLEGDVSIVNNDVQEIDSSSSSDSWIDVKKVKKKKKKVKKHKAKHKKKSSKHKKKDR